MSVILWLHMLTQLIICVVICTTLGKLNHQPNDSAESQAASIGILASQIACKKLSNCRSTSKISSNPSSNPPIAGASKISSNPSSNPPFVSQKSAQYKDGAPSTSSSTSTTFKSERGKRVIKDRANKKDDASNSMHTGGGNSVSNNKGSNKEQCGDEDRAKCFEQCYPTGTNGPRKHMLYCSYCCLSCRCDEKEENNPDATIPADVVQVLGRLRRWRRTSWLLACYFARHSVVRLKILKRHLKLSTGTPVNAYFPDSIQ